MFHSLIPLRNEQIFEGNVKCIFFFGIKRWAIDPWLMYNKIFFLVDLIWACFDHSSLNQMKTCHQTCTFCHTFPFMVFSTFPFKFYLYKKLKLSIKDYLLLIYTFMCMIIFLRIIILGFQSHQTLILTAGLGMAWNRYGLSCIVHI